MNALLIAETVSALDAALSYLINAPYTTEVNYAERKEVLMKLSASRGGLSFHLKQIKVEVETVLD